MDEPLAEVKIHVQPLFFPTVLVFLKNIRLNSKRCSVQGNVYQAPCQFLIGKWYRYFSPEDHSPGMAWFPFA